VNQEQVMFSLVNNPIVFARWILLHL